jgi:hypothetical protein
MSHVCTTKLWFRFGSSLTELAALLHGHGLLGDWDHDYDEMYEWIEGADASRPSVSLNMWRQHRDGLAFDDEPTHVYVTVDDTGDVDTSWFRVLATTLADGLGCRVAIGEITNPQAEDYVYDEHERVETRGGTSA